MSQPSSDAPLTPRQSGVWGAVLIALGCGLSRLISTQPELLRAPAWVAYTAAGAVLLAGCTLVATAAGAGGVVDVLGVLTTVALVLSGGWVAFGSGAPQCMGSLPLGIPLSDAVCRGVFGVGTVIGAGVVMLFVRHALSRRRQR